MFMRFAAFLFGMFGGGKGAGAAFQVYPGMPQRRNSSGGDLNCCAKAPVAPSLQDGA